ncbi:rRNA maturation RNase YbeY [Arachidicoccus rhizosphaerae]|uniref:Endoribonuclease YbeY n=1 Tax=Arachidicoccus rhizosphaerae TaxID=551991 RepID=A0A1H3VJA1_9BACT|nr:rRNA maturation RNase YbeY [Arachidicoccus rhizosphaerae]SDZ74751.1 rRNA maturation RNase YbeY [Arachidicoccus rhizosphaerae]
MQKVTFNYLDSSLPLKNKNIVKAFIATIFKKEKKGLNYINYIFCSDDTLLELNKQQLQHDYYTDILTFELSTDNNTESEVYISVDRVKDNAKTLQQPLEKEILRVLFHGALHLCGYKDKTKKDEAKMREMEDFYINKYYKSIVPRGTK